MARAIETMKSRFYNYVQTYLERDVRQIVNLGDLNTIDRFLRLCAARTSQIINMSEISGHVGISVPTIKKWLSILEGVTRSIFCLPIFITLANASLRARNSIFEIQASRPSFWASTPENP